MIFDLSFGSSPAQSALQRSGGPRLGITCFGIEPALQDQASACGSFPRSKCEKKHLHSTPIRTQGWAEKEAAVQKAFFAYVFDRFQRNPKARTVIQSVELTFLSDDGIMHITVWTKVIKLIDVHMFLVYTYTTMTGMRLTSQLWRSGRNKMQEIKDVIRTKLKAKLFLNAGVHVHMQSIIINL